MSARPILAEERRGGTIHVRIQTTTAAELQHLLEDYERRFHPSGYGTRFGVARQTATGPSMAPAIDPSRDGAAASCGGWTATGSRWSSCD